MKTASLVVTGLVLAASASSAFAGEGNGNPFPLAVPTAFPTGIVMLPSEGSEATVHTANSAPAGSEEGTLPDQHADAVKRYFAGQAAGAATRAASQMTAATSPHGVPASKGEL